MRPQPLIAVNDVPATSRWYQLVLGLESSHGGAEYEQLSFDGRMVLQLHHWDAHHHPYLGSQEVQPWGNGVLLWFQTDQFDAAVQRATDHQAEILEPPRLNPNANHREIWLKDPNGYVVVIAGAYGDI